MGRPEHLLYDKKELCTHHFYGMYIVLYFIDSFDPLVPSEFE